MCFTILGALDINACNIIILEISTEPMLSIRLMVSTLLKKLRVWRGVTKIGVDKSRTWRGVDKRILGVTKIGVTAAGG